MFKEHKNKVTTCGMAGHYFLSSEKLKMCKKEHTLARGTVHNTQLMMTLHNFWFLYFVAQILTESHHSTDRGL